MNFENASRAAIVPNFTTDPNTDNSKVSSGVPSLDSFGFRCEVDYARILVSLNRASNFATVTSKTHTKYAEALDEGPGRAAKHFKIQFDDPGSREKIQRALEILRLHSGGFSTEPLLEKIEVSFDCYSRTQCKADLRKMTERLFRSGAEYCSDNMRLIRRDCETEWAENVHLLRIKLDQGFTIFVGEQHADITQRIYHKTIDRKVLLPEAQHRARREVALQRTALDEAIRAFPSRQIGDATPWKFEALSKWFRFREVKPGLAFTPMQRVVMDWQALQGVRNPERPGRRVYDPKWQADSALNERARDSLRELSRRFASKRVPPH